MAPKNGPLEKDICIRKRHFQWLCWFFRGSICRGCNGCNPTDPRDPGSPSENGFMEPKYYAFRFGLDTPKAHHLRI